MTYEPYISDSSRPHDRYSGLILEPLESSWVIWILTLWEKSYFWHDCEYSGVEGYAARACDLCALQYEALSIEMQDVKLLEWINDEILM